MVSGLNTQRRAACPAISAERNHDMRRTLIALALCLAVAAPALAAPSDAGRKYLEKAAATKGAVKTASGAVVITLKEGTGAKPTSASIVKVHYTGKLIDGKVFDSSVKRGTPATFPLSQVIPCWTEGVQKIKVGGKARLVCPPETAYGAGGAPPAVPPNAVLDFEVELLSIVR